MSLIVEDLQHRHLGPVSLSLEAGECLAVTGPSGAGKTLLLRAIADLDPCEGRVSLDGRDWRGMSGPAWRRRVAYLPAEPGWWDDSVAAHFSERDRDHDRERAAELAERLLLPRAVLDWQVARLSTGERQRLALIRSLLSGPEVLLLDEPTAALDPAAREAVEGLLRERLAAGAIILLVTHDPAQAACLAGHRRHMADGRLLSVLESVDE